MNRPQLLITISAFFLLFLSNLKFIAAQIDPHSKEFEATVDSIFADKADKNSPGAAVIIMKGKEIILSKSYGSANLAFEVPFNEKTLFPLSNFTEQLVAFSIFQLEEKGLIKLEDSVNKYLPEFGFQNDVKISHLLNHSSDLPLMVSMRLLAGWKFSDPFGQDDFLNLTKKFTKDLNPDTEIGHSHAGIKVLQILVEKVSQQNFSEYASVNIFQPLGMTNTIIKNEHFKETKNISIGYDETDDGFLRNYPIELAIMCPMTYSTQKDFEKWMLNFQMKKLGRNFLEKLDQGPSLKGVAEKRINGFYCMGQQQYYNIYGQDEYYFRDTDEGHSWKWIRLKQSGLSIMAIGNLGSYIGSKVNTIENLLASKNTTAAIKEEAKKTPIKLSKKEMQTYTGSFWDNGYLFTSQVTIKEEGLYYTDLDYGWNFPMTPRAKHLFDAPDGTKIEFTSFGKQSKFTLTIPNGSKFYSEKFEAVNLKEMELAKYIGNYNSDQLNITYQVREKDNKLILKRSRKPDLELIPLGINKFRTQEVDFKLIEFKEGHQNSILHMSISNMALKNIEFEKL